MVEGLRTRPPAAKRKGDTAMPSKQSEAVKRHWEMARMVMERPDVEPPDDESWGDLTAEPRGVDYHETEAGGLPAMWAVPKRSSSDRVLLCIHGGGFVGGSIYTHRKMFGHLAKAVGVRALLVSYRLLPEGAYPKPVDDVQAAYRWLLDQGTAPGYIAFAGDSAGGWLALAVQLRAREQGLPLPAAALLISPWTDLEVSGESYETNRDKDPFFQAETVRGLAQSFLGEAADPGDPLASPLYADLTGLGPVYIQAGGDETLLDDARRLDEQANKAGVEARLDVFPGMLLLGSADEGEDLVQETYLHAWRAFGTFEGQRGLPGLRARAGQARESGKRGGTGAHHAGRHVDRVAKNGSGRLIVVPCLPGADGHDLLLQGPRRGRVEDEFLA
jgi:acetyl esterase/lipase